MAWRFISAAASRGFSAYRSGPPTVHRDLVPYNSRGKVAEGVGFEPTIGFPMPVFKTGAFDHSATPPYDRAALIRKLSGKANSDSLTRGVRFRPVGKRGEGLMGG